MTRIGCKVSMAVVVALGAGALGVADAGAADPAEKRAKAQTVSVKLMEFRVKPSTTSVRPGRPVLFEVRNIGTEDHEMVVVRSDGQALPVAADGALDEDAVAEEANFGEVEDVKPKKSKTLRLDRLPAGDYVLFCNIVEDESDGTKLSHYAQGMHTTFSVN